MSHDLPVEVTGSEWVRPDLLERTMALLTDFDRLAPDGYGRIPETDQVYVRKGSPAAEALFASGRGKEGRVFYVGTTRLAEGFLQFFVNGSYFIFLADENNRAPGEDPVDRNPGDACDDSPDA